MSAPMSASTSASMSPAAIPKARFDWKPVALLLALMAAALPAVGSGSTWLTLTVAGLAMGMIVFIIASGLTLVFGLMDVLNFGHGVFIALGAYVATSVLATVISSSAAPASRASARTRRQACAGPASSSRHPTTASGIPTAGACIRAASSARSEKISRNPLEGESTPPAATYLRAMKPQGMLIDPGAPSTASSPPSPRVDALVLRAQRHQVEMGFTLDDRVPADHPVRAIEAVIGALDLTELDARIRANEEQGGRPAIAGIRCPCNSFPQPERPMTLDQYNEAIKGILAEQQKIAQSTAQLAMSGQANPTNPEFSRLMTSQWALVQQMAKLNTDLMLGVMTPKK